MMLLSGKKQNFQSWDHSPQVLDYQDFWITGHWITGILLYMKTTMHCKKPKNSFILTETCPSKKHRLSYN
jgi:hypothetical protein